MISETRKMNQNNNTDFLWSYIMDEEEQKECHRIIDPINQTKKINGELRGYLRIGLPSITTDFVEGYVYGSIMCVKNGHRFDYYLFRVSERGCVHIENCTDNPWTKKCTSSDKIDAMISFLQSRTRD